MTELTNILKIGYTLVIASFLLMIWISLTEGRSIDNPAGPQYPPCFFNSMCTCSKSMPDLGIVQCQHVHLPTIPLQINVSKVFKLHLHNNGLRTIEPYFLQSTGLYKIAIVHNPLSFIPDEAFMGLERSLWELDLRYNELTTIPTRALKYLQKLRHLDLSGNDIMHIAPESWRGLSHTLQTLILKDNSINTLPADSFSGLPEVETIDLSGNNLQLIDPSVFRDGMAKLAYLILADNQLSSIPYQAVSTLKALKVLDLSRNVVNKMQVGSEVGVQYSFQISLDELRLDWNQITQLEAMSFQYFDFVNKTVLDGNPLTAIQDNAFRPAKIRELYLRSCGLTSVSPGAFESLDNILELLDLSGNNISELPDDIFLRLSILKSLSLGDNSMNNLNIVEKFSSLQFTLNKLDLSRYGMTPVRIQDLRRLRNLRVLSLSTLNQNVLSPDDFKEFGVDLEELQINHAGLKTIKSNAFKYVHGLKKLDLSENSITSIEKFAFTEVGHSLSKLIMSHSFAMSHSSVPADALKELTNLEILDLSNNKIKDVPETSFHFLKDLKVLELQDNVVQTLHKGTFQGDIHTKLEKIYLSFNNIKSIKQHTFVDLPSLHHLFLDDNFIDDIERRAFMNLEDLKVLNLKGNKLTKVNYEAFQNLPELELLDMSYNKLGGFDFSMFDQVGSLSMLTVNVSHNELKNLVQTSTTDEFGGGLIHANIKVLDLSHNNISNIAKKFFKPAELSLTHLYLGHNGLMNVTMDVFGNMPNLQVLDISTNMLYELEFDCFRNTKRLQVLNVAHNRIAEIPNDLLRFVKNIKMVDMSHNRLRALPDNFFREEGIERLDVSHNLIGKLPLSTFSVSAALTLHELDVSWNSISSLSHGGALARFRNLNWLDLSYNRLAQIDAGTFKDLPRLSSLDLGNNLQLALEPNGLSFQGLEYTLLHLNLDNVSFSQVPTLPTPHLISLSLAHNYLPTVPPEIATNLTSLCSLNLNYNDLTSVPIVTHSLPELRYLTLAANPIKILSNTSLLGVKDHLKELDLRYLDLLELESGALCKMQSLRTLKLDFYPNVKQFNIPRILTNNCGIQDLEINVDKDTSENLDKELFGTFPSKLRNITLTGKGLSKLGSHVFEGVTSQQLNICIRNTSITTLNSDIFQNLKRTKNVTLEIVNNDLLKSLQNPSSGYRPHLFRKTFLTGLFLEGNKWNCDCDLGWIEVWHRKKRQYICEMCEGVHDDLRHSYCANKNNQSLVEILKTDIECGWSSAPKHYNHLYTITFIITLLLTVNYSYIFN